MKLVQLTEQLVSGALLCLALCAPAFGCSRAPVRIDERVIIVEGRARILTEQRKGEEFSDSFEYEYEGTAEVVPSATLRNDLRLKPPYRFYFWYYEFEGCIFGAAPSEDFVQKLYLRVSETEPRMIQLIAVGPAGTDALDR